VAVAKAPRGHTDVRGTCLGSQSGDHRRRELDAVDRYSQLAEWQSDASRADAELESRTAPGQVREHVEARFDERGLEEFRPQVLVALGDPLIEVRLWHGGKA
jgi:hypothetical protein